MRPHRPASTKSTYRSLRDKQESNGRTLALDGNAWRNLRRSVLREQPLCEMCLRVEEVPVMATDVDHIDNDPTLRDKHRLLDSIPGLGERTTVSVHPAAFLLRHVP